MLGFISATDSENNREYVGIDTKEDILLKFHAVVKGDGMHILPTLANKKKYYMVEGLPAIRNTIDLNNGGRLSAQVKSMFCGYIADEANAIIAAHKLRTSFIQHLQ